MAERIPHNGDGKGKPIEIPSQRTLREILDRHLSPQDAKLFYDLEADLLALIRAREAMTRERCDIIARTVHDTDEPECVRDGDAHDREIWRVGYVSGRVDAGKAIRESKLPCEENAP